MFNIFQQPWTLVGAAVLLLFAMLTFRSILPEKRRWWQLLLPLLLTSAAFTLDFAVKTDLEKINAVINKGVKAVEDENCYAIEAIISDSYSDSYHKTKKDLMYHCRARLSPPLVEKNKKWPPTIEISPPKATVILTVVMHFDKQSYVYTEFNKPLMITKTKLYLQKGANKKWLITRAEVLEIDRQPTSWKQIK